MLMKSIASVKNQIRQLTPFAKHQFSQGNNKFIFKNCAGAQTPQRVAYAEEHSKHRMKLSLYDLEPRTENAWIAPNATISKFNWIV